MSDLIIVESPSKINTVKRTLGEGYNVVACVGHVRDLPKSKLAVDVEHGFEPTYVDIAGKETVINEIKKYAKKYTIWKFFSLKSQRQTILDQKRKGIVYAKKTENK